MSNKLSLLRVLVVLTIIFTATQLSAQNRPIQIALVTPIQIFLEDNPISGIRLNLIYGRSVSVIGLDLGFINHTTTGISKGYQAGTVGVNDADFLGWQNNFVNVTKGNFEGFQLGFVNYAKSASGFQLGVVNYAENMNGLQIGLLNIIRSGGAFPMFPIVNWSF